MFLEYHPSWDVCPYELSDGCGNFMELDLDDLIELKNLIEKVLTNPEDCDTM